MIICYTVPEIWCMMDIIIFHFELFFALELFELFFWDIIILHKCTINNNHMIIWLLRYQLQQTNFFAILGHFWPFYLSNSPKNENIKKWKKKKHLEISSFCMIVPTIMIIGYTVPEIWHVIYGIFIFHFGLFFTVLPA